MRYISTLVLAALLFLAEGENSGRCLCHRFRPLSDGRTSHRHIRCAEAIARIRSLKEIKPPLTFPLSMKTRLFDGQIACGG